MNARVHFTKGAEADLLEISRYIRRRDGAGRAREALVRLQEMVALLETQPEAGSVPEELASLGITSYRQLVSPPYRIIYSHVGDHVYVLVVADGRRDFQSLLKRRLLE
ncbi:MAG: type II toxin-antitoxin system RelE/ParE family toxin [Trueperaceae bacterium]